MDAKTMETIRVVEDFNMVFNTGDVDAIMARFTDDCVFENTSPSPDGERFKGQEAVRAVWTEFFGGGHSPHFEAEDMFASGDRCTVRWRYTWKGEDGEEGHVRGVDVFRVADGKVAEKLAYVKG
jgi:ketosteroid isomerase-like protein